ncbi:UNVERIFIED_CONTAM: hypothetical protein GTU68_055607 [Idotea baltica]|nr:hypothetical protein [Idotea baltica]
MTLTADIDAERPVLIAGPTASGKSALALEIVETSGGIIVNADALQVFDGWRIVTARPDAADQAQADHALYGHVPFDASYSVGTWLRDIRPFLTGPKRPIIVGGTGLYFQALTQGLVDIPATSAEIRAQADRMLAEEGRDALLKDIDASTRARIDVLNPMRVQRAWEVQRTTGRGMAAWQDQTPAPLLNLQDCVPLVFDADKDWLNDRIALRFDQMIDEGALDEARAMLPYWNPTHLSSKAIGAPELIAHLRGELTLEACKNAAINATRQFAKRQRTWFRSKMKAWQAVTPN